MEKVKHYYKIGLLTLNKEGTKFLVIEKFHGDVGYQEYQMPGGQIEKETEMDCLKRETKEELDCGIKSESVEYVGKYEGPAAGGGLLTMTIYRAELIGDPKPSSEIKSLHWIGKEYQTDLRASEFIRTRIFPDLIRKGILK
ncbi:MAG: NUDIX domain-containing protein [Candidatus Micrarchaeota archaeon]|nr:NUDIX domain-containing protein [Candidatus Micrarchaeota archaeon]